MKRKKMESSHKTQKDQEKRIAGLIDGKRQPLSGASDYAKGDAKGIDFLAEAKQTAGKSLSIKQAWLEKIDREAMAVNKYPILTVHFLNMNKLTPKDWIMVPDWIFKEMYEAWKKRF
jgi:hypothetical protein